MSHRYDLNKMLEEIKEDQQGEKPQEKEMSQEDIKRMLLERLNAQKGKKT